MSKPRYTLGKDTLPPEAMRRFYQGLAIAKVQEELVRTGAMTSRELDLYLWSVEEEPADAESVDGGHLVVRCERIAAEQAG